MDTQSGGGRLVKIVFLKPGYIYIFSNKNYFDSLLRRYVQRGFVCRNSTKVRARLVDL